MRIFMCAGLTIAGSGLGWLVGIPYQDIPRGTVLLGAGLLLLASLWACERIRRWRRDYPLMPERRWVSPDGRHALVLDRSKQLRLIATSGKTPDPALRGMRVSISGAHGDIGALGLVRDRRGRPVRFPGNGPGNHVLVGTWGADWEEVCAHPELYSGPEQWLEAIAPPTA